MMTTMAAMLGTLPIALAIGAGSELRQPLGVAVVGGLLVSQTLTLFTIPVTYIYMDRLADWIGRFARARGDARAVQRGQPQAARARAHRRSTDTPPRGR